MSTVRSYERGNYRRVCDICATLYNRSELTKRADGKYYCPKEAGERTRIELDRLMAGRKLPQVKPVIDAQGRNNVDVYQAHESVLFNYLVERPIVDATATGGLRYGVPPADTISVAGPGPGTPSSTFDVGAAETINYLHALIQEGARPSRWITDATRKLRELADWLLSRQYGSPSAPAGVGDVASTDTRYGNQNEVFGTCFQPVGLAYIKAYEILGDQKYLTAATIAATCLRRMQCGDLRTSNYSTTSNLGTSRLHIGWPTDTFDVSGSTTTFDHIYSQADSPLEFLTRLKAQAGDITVGDATAVGEYSYATAATLSAMIADALSFIANGATNSGAGDKVLGWTPQTPYRYFRSYRSDLSASGSWFRDNAADGTQSCQVQADEYCQYLRDLYYYEGASTRVAALFDWLMSASSNSTYETPASYGPGQVASSIYGTYNPQNGFCYTIRLTGATNSDGSAAIVNGEIGGPFSGYVFALVGLTAPLFSTRQRAAFKAIKDTLGTQVVRGYPTTATSIRDDLRLMHFVGLSYQTGNAKTGTAQSIGAIAQVGAIYRYSPKAANLGDPQ